MTRSEQVNWCIAYCPAHGRCFMFDRDLKGCLPKMEKSKYIGDKK